MTFLGICDGEYVVPGEVTAAADVECPQCGASIDYRKGNRYPLSSGRTTWRAAHFVQNRCECTPGDGAGGARETAVHKMMKYAFAGYIEEQHPDATTEVETALPDGDVAHKPDVLVSFPDGRGGEGSDVLPDETGRGVAVETQYRNTTKSKHRTLNDYGSSGYSVVWTEPPAFGLQGTSDEAVGSIEIDPGSDAIGRFSPDEAARYAADVSSLDTREVPHPPHSWEIAKRCIRSACSADDHDWVALTGAEPTAYWRECRKCGIADVTAAAVGQDVETPNVERR